jgi:DNA-binding CsgD family transcriptional regulator
MLLPGGPLSVVRPLPFPRRLAYSQQQMTQAELAKLLAAPKQSDSVLDSLEDRELEVISLLAQGRSFRQTAQEMGLDPDRFESLKKAIQKKLKLKDDVKLIQFAAKHRI